jgi:hypothetical protein
MKRSRFVPSWRIVQSILEHERGCALFVKEGGFEDWKNASAVHESWYPAFFRLLQQGVSAEHGAQDVFRNLCVINFNYDRCFEHFLCRALRKLFQLQERQAQDLVVKRLKIFHPYGMVGQLPWIEGRGVPLARIMTTFSAPLRRSEPSTSKSTKELNSGQCKMR